MSEEQQVETLENAETVGSTPQATEGTGEQPTVEATPAETEETAEPEQTGESEEVVAEPAFVPKTKVKAWKKEIEIPQEFHALMKDADSEKKIHDLFERAYGVEGYKERQQAMAQDLDAVRSENGQWRAQIQHAASLYQGSQAPGQLHKMDDFFKALQVDPEHVMSWAVERAKLAQLPPEQRQLVEARINAERAKDAAQFQQQTVSQQAAETQRAAKQVEFNTYMANPEVQRFAKELDSKFGKEGLFAQEVINAGQRELMLSGKNLSVVEAMRAVIAHFGLTGQAQAAQAAATAAAPAAPASNKKVVQRQASTIPNVGGSPSASPVGKSKPPRSLADVKELYKKAMAGEQI